MTFFVDEIIVLSRRIIWMILRADQITVIEVVSFYELIVVATPVDAVIVGGGFVKGKSKH